jgi:hypothetical protein
MDSLRQNGHFRPGARSSGTACRHSPVALLKLNLGCGSNPVDGYVNVDKFGEPDVCHDLEVFPWPWPDNSADRVQMIHVLEHLGASTEVYFGIIRELYRVCCHGALIRIVVPHSRHQNFFDDPTHVRVVTPLGLRLFSKSENRIWAEEGSANSPLGLYLDVDLELKNLILHPSDDWYALHPERPVNEELFLRESNLYNNLVLQYEMILEVVKPQP